MGDGRELRDLHARCEAKPYKAEQQKNEPHKSSPGKKSRGKFTRRKIQITLICAGILFVCLVVCREEVAVVLRKAVSICLECIGIG